MTSEAMVLIDLIPLVCITITLGHVLIDPSLGGAMTIICGDQAAVAVDDRDGSVAV